MNRRDFLDPRLVAGAAGQLLSAWEEIRNLDLPTPDKEFTLLRFSRRAMATTFEVLLPFGVSNSASLAETALDEVDRLEDQLTVFRPTSEVSRLNQTAAQKPIPVEKRLFQLLAQAAGLTRGTEGAFDIATGALTKLWGFYRRSAKVPTPEELAEVMTRVGMKHIVLDPRQQTVRYLRPGLEINLGSIGKGYALDRAADLLRCQWPEGSVLMHGGHSSVYALGNGSSNGHGWRVGIRHPWNPERRLAIVHLQNRALGTSAATFQHLEYQGRKLGHILDPRTGWPAEDMASASVVAPTAAEADALATAFFILGVEKAKTYCENHPDIGAVLLPEGDSATPVSFGLSAEDVELLPGEN
jgi:thiamine biosynthesis lipoprotein